MSLMKHLSLLVLYHLHTRHRASPRLSGFHRSRRSGALLRLRTCTPRARSHRLKGGPSRPRTTADSGFLHRFEGFSGSPLYGPSSIVTFPFVVDSRPWRRERDIWREIAYQTCHLVWCSALLALVSLHRTGVSRLIRPSFRLFGDLSDA